MGAVLHEVIAPDVFGEHRYQAHDRAIIEPQTASFGLFLGYFEPFLAPNTLHPFMIDQPALIAQHGGHSAVAVPAVLTGQTHDRCSQDFVVIRNSFVISLGGSGLSDRPAGTSFGDTQSLDHLLDGYSAPVRGNYFFETAFMPPPP